MAQIEAIAATPGLSALMAGPFDLAVSMGLHGDWRDNRVKEALLRLVSSAKDNDIPSIMPVFSPDPSECRDLVEYWADRGVTCFMIGSDKIIAANALEGWMTTVAGAIPASAET
jgi:2-keto-3-deoxy-L-rhamnonate aldolase RhmA